MVVQAGVVCARMVYVRGDVPEGSELEDAVVYTALTPRIRAIVLRSGRNGAAQRHGRGGRQGCWR